MSTCNRKSNTPNTFRAEVKYNDRLTGATVMGCLVETEIILFCTDKACNKLFSNNKHSNGKK